MIQPAISIPQKTLDRMIPDSGETIPQLIYGAHVIMHAESMLGINSEEEMEINDLSDLRENIFRRMDMIEKALPHSPLYSYPISHTIDSMYQDEFENNGIEDIEYDVPISSVDCRFIVRKTNAQAICINFSNIANLFETELHEPFKKLVDMLTRTSFFFCHPANCDQIDYALECIWEGFDVDHFETPEKAELAQRQAEELHSIGWRQSDPNTSWKDILPQVAELAQKSNSSHAIHLVRFCKALNAFATCPDDAFNWSLLGLIAEIQSQDGLMTTDLRIYDSSGYQEIMDHIEDNFLIVDSNYSSVDSLINMNPDPQKSSHVLAAMWVMTDALVALNQAAKTEHGETHA